MARPTEYKPEFVQTTQKLCEGGATDQDVADALEVDVRTLYRWKGKHPEFCQALKLGKEPANERVKHSLYHRAVGFRYVEQQTIKVRDSDGNEHVELVEVEKVVPPDPTSGIFFLKNRMPEEFRDRQEITGADGKDLIPELPADEVARQLAFILAQAAHKKDGDGS